MDLFHAFSFSGMQEIIPFFRIYIRGIIFSKRDMKKEKMEKGVGQY